MNIKFQLRCFAFVLFLCIPLTACSTAASYRDDRSAAELMAKIKAVVPSEAGYRSVESDYPDSAFGDDADTIKRNVSNWSVLVSDRSDAYPDQIMILHVDGASNQLSAVADAVRRYGDTQQTRSREYFRMYAPTELPKLDNLSVKICGNYILLTILDEQQTADAHAVFERELVS